MATEFAQLLTYCLPHQYQIQFTPHSSHTNETMRLLQGGFDCRFCRTETETAHHITCSCEASTRRSHSIFGKLSLLWEDLETAFTIGLCSLVKNTALLSLCWSNTDSTIGLNLRPRCSRARVRKSRYWGETLQSPIHCCDVTMPPYMFSGELCTSPLHFQTLVCVHRMLSARRSVLLCAQNT